MYKVKYYTVAELNDGSRGNIEQFRDIYYTDHNIENIPMALQNNVDRMYYKRKNRFMSIILEIEFIEGHMEIINDSEDTGGRCVY